MSDRLLQSIEHALEGDWWYFAGAVQAILARDQVRHRVKSAGDGQKGVVITVGEPFTSEAAIRIVRANDTTVLTIAYDPVHAVQMQGVATFLCEASSQIEKVRRTWVPSGEDVISRFYRARAQGSRITLRQLAEDTGFSYEALKKHKQRYDAAGKWGSRAGQDI